MAGSLFLLFLYGFLNSRHRILWWDEIFGWQLLTDPSFRHMLRAWNLGADGGGLAFYLLGRLWLHLFGFCTLSYRAFSVSGVCLAYVVMWRLLRRFYVLPVCLITLLAVFFGSTTILWQLLQTRFYGLLLAAVALSLFAAVSNTDGGTGTPARAPWRSLLFVFASNTLLVETHPFGLLYVGLLLAGSFIADLLSRRRRPLFYLVALAPACLLFFSWKAMQSSARVGKPWFWTTTPHRLDLKLAYTPAALPSCLKAVLVLLLVAFAFAPFRALLREALAARAHLLGPAMALALAPVVFFCLSRGGTSYFVDRYMIAFTLGVAIMLAELASDLVALAHSRVLLTIGALCVLLFPVRAIFKMAWHTYPRNLEIPPHDFTPALSALIPSDLPVVFERVDLFTIMLHQRPSSRNYTFLLDYANATAPETPRGFVSGYNEMMNWRKADYHSSHIQDASTFLTTQPTFVVVHGGGMHWLDDRILADPAHWQARQIGQTSNYGDYDETLWLVTRHP